MDEDTIELIQRLFDPRSRPAWRTLMRSLWAGRRAVSMSLSIGAEHNNSQPRRGGYAPGRDDRRVGRELRSST